MTRFFREKIVVYLESKLLSYSGTTGHKLGIQSGKKYTLGTGPLRTPQRHTHTCAHTFTVTPWDNLESSIHKKYRRKPENPEATHGDI